MAYDNEMKGVLFPNDKKGNDKAPGYKGTVTIKGVEYEMAGWLNEGQSGKYMSLKVSEKMAKQPQHPVGQSANQNNSQFGGTPFPDDDIPF